MRVQTTGQAHSSVCNARVAFINKKIEGERVKERREKKKKGNHGVFLVAIFPNKSRWTCAAPEMEEERKKEKKALSFVQYRLRALNTTI